MPAANSGRSQRLLQPPRSAIERFYRDPAGRSVALMRRSILELVGGSFEPSGFDRIAASGLANFVPRLVNCPVASPTRIALPRTSRELTRYLRCTAATR